VTVQDAITNLFVAFASHRNVEQATLYRDAVIERTSCVACIEEACRTLMTTSKRLPALAQVLDEVTAQLRSDDHGAHITLPQLAPHDEQVWRTEGANLIASFVDGDRDLAAFIAAEMWWTHVGLGDVTTELRECPVWITTARVFLADKDSKVMVQRAFERARWAAEHAEDEVIPRHLLMLEGAA